jgi:RimJ/RimL family protein N-acetyltransferase
MNKTAIGICGLFKRDTIEDIEIGFALLPQLEGHGYAFESASVILAQAQDQHKLTRVTAVCKPDNLPSIKLLEKLGFKTTASMRPGPDGEALKYFFMAF